MAFHVKTSLGLELSKVPGLRVRSSTSRTTDVKNKKIKKSETGKVARKIYDHREAESFHKECSRKGTKKLVRYDSSHTPHNTYTEAS